MQAKWVETLDVFTQQYEATGDYSRAWAETRDWFEARARVTGVEDPTQAWRSVSGNVFEHACKQIIKRAVPSVLGAREVRIMLWGEVPEEVRDGVLSERVWHRGNVRQPAIVPSLVDAVAATVDKLGHIEDIIAAYSCKSSVRERYQQDLFWVEKLRGRGIRFCFITIDDAFIRHAAGDTGSSSDKSLTLSKAMYDRIYLLTDRGILTDVAVFRPLSEVASDIQNWLVSR